MARYLKTALCSLGVYLAILLAGCGGGSGSDSGNSSQSSSPDSNTTQEASNPEFTSLGFEIVDGSAWSEGSVRQVLDVFAYSGHATDSQISTWADMRPEDAIREMLTFEEHNLLLSPPADSDVDDLHLRDGTLRGLGEFWSSDDEDNGVRQDERDRYLPEQGIRHIWLRAATSRGLNPFRQKIGLWESNYHLATNLHNNVTPAQMLRYYDDIMKAHASGAPYQDVLTIAATSAAIASQYGHTANRYRNDICMCNEDFAREYYQLFFGILGDYAPEYHELITIKNTAYALTGLQFERNPDGTRGDDLLFDDEFHYPGELEMMGVSYWGANVFDRIAQLSQDAINHPESLNNLPVKIIEGLADDNLDSYKIAQLRDAWSSMPEKNLLTFLRAYAVSTTFHSDDRVKQLSSIDRQIKIANNVILSNEEGYLYLTHMVRLQDEGVRSFIPTHNVFGNQTGQDAYKSADVFRQNYNTATERVYVFRRAHSSNHETSWLKDWGKIIPVNNKGKYTVKDVSEWLWKRLVGDELRNFGLLEQAYLYAFLATNADLASLVSPDHPDILLTSFDIQSDPDLFSLIRELGNSEISLDSRNADERRHANERIGKAIAFIVGTPYMFVNEGIHL